MKTVLIVAGLLVIFGIGSISGMLVTRDQDNRFYLQSNGQFVYKIDRRTGDTWLVFPTGERQIANKSSSTLTK